MDGQNGSQFAAMDAYVRKAVPDERGKFVRLFRFSAARHDDAAGVIGQSLA